MSITFESREDYLSRYQAGLDLQRVADQGLVDLLAGNLDALQEAVEVNRDRKVSGELRVSFHRRERMTLHALMRSVEAARDAEAGRVEDANAEVAEFCRVNAEVAEFCRVNADVLQAALDGNRIARDFAELNAADVQACVRLRELQAAWLEATLR